MSYRVMTYQDPYHLEHTSFWKEIRDLPHFCASSVMSQSLWELYGPDRSEHGFSSFFFPLDSLVKAAYYEWETDIEKQIRQYSALSRQIRSWEKADQGKRPDLFSALNQNINSLLEALRMFCELGIDPQSLDEKLANTEQRAFINLYWYITNYAGNEKTQDLAEAFSINNFEVKSGKVFSELLKQAKREENDKLEWIKKQKDTQENINRRIIRQKRIDRLDEMILAQESKPIRKIVIHGIHQFKPLQMRLIAALDEAGYEIIFLYNYLPEYDHLYATWESIYSLFGVNIEHDLQGILQIDETDSTRMAQILAGVLNA